MIGKKTFGKTRNGREVTAYTLKGAGGLSLEVLDWGGRVNRIILPSGRDIALGFDNPEGWEGGDPYYFVSTKNLHSELFLAPDGGSKAPAAEAKRPPAPPYRP